MLKILLWVVSKDTTYLEDALKILEQQHNGIELIGTAAGEEILTIDAVGGVFMTYCLSSAQKKSA